MPGKGLGRWLSPPWYVIGGICTVRPSGPPGWRFLDLLPVISGIRPARAHFRVSGAKLGRKRRTHMRRLRVRLASAVDRTRCFEYGYAASAVRVHSDAVQR